LVSHCRVSVCLCAHRLHAVLVSAAKVVLYPVLSTVSRFAIKIDRLLVAVCYLEE